MAGRSGLDPTEEGKSYSALFVLLVALLLVGAVWSIWDDNISRRPWKEYQVEFDRYAYNKNMKQAAALGRKLATNPRYKELSAKLAAARAELESGKTRRKLARLEARVKQLKVVSDERDQDLRFTKSYLTEEWYDYNHAIQQKRDPSAYKAEIDRLEKRLKGEQRAANKAKADLQAAKDEIEKIHSTVANLTAELAKVTKKRDDLVTQARTYLKPVTLFGKTLFTVPRIPKIEQTAINDFDRNAFRESVERVDRCRSCHTGIDKRGFEDAPQPFRTHTNFAQIILKHPPDKFGCTPCHEGQGPAVNSVAMAHGEVPHWDAPLLRGDEMQSRCIKCHIDVGSLRNSEGEQIAGAWVRGERLFEQMGCHGCHLLAGYEDMPKIGPYLKLAAAKLDRSWAVRWIENPHAFRPHTRMPNFMLNDGQATDIAAYIFQSSAQSSKSWIASHPEPASLSAAIKSPAMVEEGKGLFDSVGCKACHTVEKDKYGTPIGHAGNFKPAAARTAKDFAPNLDAIAEKTSPTWIYYWIKNPRDFSPDTAMPSLRLSDHEAMALTAYLMTHGRRRETPGLETALADPARIERGKGLIRKYGCFGCHAIEGMDRESRIGVELTTFGSKHLDELFFGDRTDIAQTWDGWTFNKLKHPRIYATEDVEQLMPDFELQDSDIKDLRVFLAGLTEPEVPEKYRMAGTARQARIVAGRRKVNFYNCVGCHVIEHRGGYIRRFYPGDQISFAPPLLDGEGARVQPQWLFGFLQEPTPIRPWLKVRMPTFGFAEEKDDADMLVNYFTALADVQYPYVFVNSELFPAHTLAAGKKLMSYDYFNCFSCHQQGEKKPEGPPSGWAPDLALAHQRLNPTWILRWLRDPQKVQPGTKMPTYYPDGPEDILGGDEKKQIEAIRDYIFWLGANPGGRLRSPVVKKSVQMSKR